MVYYEQTYVENGWTYDFGQYNAVTINRQMSVLSQIIAVGTSKPMLQIVDALAYGFSQYNLIKINR